MLSYLCVELALQKYILLVVCTRPFRARPADMVTQCSYSHTKLKKSKKNKTLIKRFVTK